MATPVASIVFPTRNRRDLLLKAVAAALGQTVDVEVLVLDDGSTDGSAEAVAERFSGRVNYHHLATGHGPAFQRNRGIELARAPVVFALDDDSVLVSSRTVEQTLAEFDCPRVGAVGIPFINVRRAAQLVHQRAPDSHHVWVEHTFVGAAHAVRRDVFLSVGGYREQFYYMGEEGDLTLRMLTHGWITRLGRADPIEHHESPQRATVRADFFGRRNDVLFAIYNVPSVNLPVHLAGTLINGLRAAISSPHPCHQCAGLIVGVWQGVQRWIRGERKPVARDIYRLHRLLKKNGAKALNGIERILPQCFMA